jgi:uncharacterized protein (TIGR02300 family)
MEAARRSRQEAEIVTKAELGTKRLCPNCGAKYYDLNRSPIICPRCGTRFELPNATARSRPAAKPEIAPVPEEAEIEKETVETVSLEEADDEAADTGAVEVETADDDEEIEGGEDDTFLADEDDDDEEDVEDIVGDVEEEE